MELRDIAEPEPCVGEIVVDLPSVFEEITADRGREQKVLVRPNG